MNPNADIKNAPHAQGVAGAKTDDNINISSSSGAVKTKPVRAAKYWAGVFYPESMPANWIDVLTSCHVPCVVSPLHDRDINSDGTLKKPHYHVMFCYSNTTTCTSASCILTQLGSTSHSEHVMSAVGYYRYLTHKDNPEKAQYDERDIRVFNGFSYPDNIGQRTTTEQIEICQKILDVVMSECCPPNYIALIEYLRAMDMSVELEYTMMHTIFIKEVLASKRAYNSDLMSWQDQQRRKSGVMTSNEVNADCSAS